MVPSAVNTFVDHDWANLSAGSVVFFPGDSRPHIIGVDAFAKIQDGVNHTLPGGTEKVAAGTYTEQVKIGQSLTLLGAGQDTTTIHDPGSLTRNAATGQTAIVDIGNAAHASIQGLTVSGPGLTYADLNYGIFVGGNADLNISDAHITHIRDFQFSGVQSGVGIRIGANFANQVATGTISNVTIDDYQKGGIVIDGIIGGPSSYAKVTGSTITGAGRTPLIAQNGVQVSRGANATITDNTISNNYYTGPDTGTGILFYLSDPANSIISGNNFSGNQYDIIDATTTTTLSSSANPIAVGNALKLTAAVVQRTPSTPPSPTPLPGTVQFIVDGVAVGSPQSLDANNQAYLTIATLTVGPHTIEADYSGSNLLEANPSSAVIAQVVSSGPVAQDQSYTAIQEHTDREVAFFGVLAGATGPNGDSLRAQVVRGPSHGKVHLRSDGSFDYRPKGDFLGTDSFTYVAIDTKTGARSNVATATMFVMLEGDKKASDFSREGGKQVTDNIKGNTIKGEGTVRVYTGATIVLTEGKAVKKLPGAIAFEFTADKQLKDCHWLQTQTLFRKNAAGKEISGDLVEVPKPDGTKVYVPYGTTFIDSGNPKTAYYDGSGGPTLKGDKLLGIMDRPRIAAKPDAKYPTLGIHFTTTLVCEGKPIYTFTWDWVKTKDGEGVHNLKGMPGSNPNLKQDPFFYGFTKVDKAGMVDPKSLQIVPNPIPQGNR